MGYNAIREWNCEEWLYMGGIEVGRLGRGCGNRGGMAQISIASSRKTMTAVFVAITYKGMS